jgi:hypothetical protein
MRNEEERIFLYPYGQYGSTTDEMMYDTMYVILYSVKYYCTVHTVYSIYIYVKRAFFSLKK